MKILLLGKNGQVGWELQRALATLGRLIALDRHHHSFCGDLANPQGLVQTIRQLAPNVIVNAAAFTAVDMAESQPELAFLINKETVAVLAQEMAALGGWFIHYSTDYVFNGYGTTPWQETDQTQPLNVYGKSKLAGEESIINSGCKHLIFRTSWVYGRRGNNFIKSILKLANEREILNIVADQIGSPSGAELIADVSAHAIRMCLQKPELSGLYHLAASGEVSWHGYTHFIVETAKSLGHPLQVSEIKPISSEAYPRPAIRPLNSRLNTTKLTKAFSIFLPEWKLGVERVLVEILG